MRVLDLWLLTGQDIDIPVENLMYTCHFLFPELKSTAQDVSLSFMANLHIVGTSRVPPSTARTHPEAIPFHTDPLEAIVVAVIQGTDSSDIASPVRFEFVFPSITLLSYLERLQGPPQNHVADWGNPIYRHGCRARMTPVNGFVNACYGTRKVVCPTFQSPDEAHEFSHFIIIDYNQWPLRQVLHGRQAPFLGLESRRWRIHAISSLPKNTSIFANWKDVTYLPYSVKTVRVPTREIQQYVLGSSFMVLTEDAIFFVYKDPNSGDGLVCAII